jgi:hypothetical protein
MRFLVLGAGLQGSASAYDLLRAPDVEELAKRGIAVRLREA